MGIPRYCLAAAQRVFTEFSRLLGVQSYFTGSQASLGDILLAAQMDLFSLAPEWAQLTADRTNLVTWLERMNERPRSESKYLSSFASPA